jgi:Sulfotransferase domain
MFAMLERLRLPAELVPSLPPAVRTVARRTQHAYGRATAGQRPLPDFLIIGAQKAGTTALFAYLRWHPEITGPSWKEVSFFDRRYREDERAYRASFPAKPRQWIVARRRGRWPLVGEASPSYILHPLAPRRARDLVPEARLIAVLRNPVDRAYSHYQHEVRLGREPFSFEDALDREGERLRGEVERMVAEPSYFSGAWWNYTYVARGRYAEQLARWLAVFPREQLLILFMEELERDAAATYARVLDFLGARPHDLGEFPRIFDHEYAAMEPATRARLEATFEEPNRELARLLGREPPWAS